VVEVTSQIVEERSEVEVTALSKTAEVTAATQEFYDQTGFK
jgi:hypothetical protein